MSTAVCRCLLLAPWARQCNEGQADQTGQLCSELTAISSARMEELQHRVEDLQAQLATQTAEVCRNQGY